MAGSAAGLQLNGKTLDGRSIRGTERGPLLSAQFMKLIIAAMVLLGGTASNLAWAETLADLRLLPETSHWCGRGATVAFSIVNVTNANVHLWVVPFAEPSSGDLPLWRGGYSLRVGRRMGGRSLSCDATDGGSCVAERQEVVLQPGARNTWQIKDLSIRSGRRTSQDAALAVDVRVKVAGSGSGSILRLSWSGGLEISKARAQCWQAAVQQGVAADGAAPRR